VELRCDWKKHGELLDGDIIEVRCGSQLCGKQKGVVVLHRFNLHTGELIETKRYRDPVVSRKEERHADHHDRAPVRYP
jgi:hypothetical protein